MKSMVSMRCYAALLLAVWLLPVATRGEAKSNLLVNAGFESGVGVDVIDAWMGEGDHEFREQASAFGYTLGEGTFPEGVYALKMFSGAADIYQFGIPVKGNTPYVLGGQFYHSSTQDVIDQTAGSLRGFLRLEWFDRDQHLIREDYSTNHNGTASADLWVPIETVFLSPPNAASAKVHVQTDIDSGGGSIFADAILFGEKKGR